MDHSMIDDILNASGGKSKSKSTEEPRAKNSGARVQSMFPNPMMDVQLLKEYLGGPGNNINQLADARYISPGQVMQRINTTARAVSSYLNEDIEPEMLNDIYKHRKFFQRSLLDFLEQKDFNDPDKFEQNILKGFDLLTPARQFMLLEAMEARVFQNKSVA